jgi:hypothetical protein
MMRCFAETMVSVAGGSVKLSALRRLHWAKIRQRAAVPSRLCPAELGRTMRPGEEKSGFVAIFIV